MGLDFDIRYRKILELLKIDTNSSSILEIGALTPACLSSYISEEINYLGINKDYEDSQHRIQKVDFLANTFENESFTHVLSTDTIEHIEKGERAQFIDEMVRVAQKTVVVGVPNPESEEYEKALVSLLEASTEGRHYIKFLKEHEEFGIPKREEMRSYFEKYNFTTVENFNLRYWIGILLSDIFDFDLNLEKIPNLNEIPAYRTFYVVSK